MRRGTCRPSLPKWLGQVSFHPEFSRSGHAGSSGSAWGPLALPLSQKTRDIMPGQGRPQALESSGFSWEWWGDSAHSWENWTRPLCSQLQEICKVVKPRRGRGGSMCTPVCVLRGKVLHAPTPILDLGRQLSPTFLQSLSAPLISIHPSSHPGTPDADPHKAPQKWH